MTLDGLAVVPRPLVGWRLFTVDHLRLESLYFHGPETSFAFNDHDWHRARCRSHGPHAEPTHTAPNADCRCGFYAAATREELVAYIGRPEPSWLQPIVAKVALAGRVIVHEHGYRAEAMRVVAWWPIVTWAERMARHAKTEALRGWALWFSREVRSGQPCQHCGMPRCARHTAQLAAVQCARCGRPSGERGCWNDRAA